MGPSPSFSEQFDRLSHWRKSFAAQMASFREWLAAHELLDAAVQEQLQRLENLLRGDKVSVAFVAEFSRGKSELINAVFLPTTAGASCPPAPGAPPCARPS